MNPANTLTWVVIIWIIGVVAIAVRACSHPMPRTIKEPVPVIPITEHPVPEVEEKTERSTAAERTTNV